MAAIAYPVPHDRRACTGRPAVRLRVAQSRPRRRSRRTYLRRRLVLVVAVLWALVAAWALVGGLGGGSLTAPEPSTARLLPVSATVHVVQPGDTLWTIARRVQPEGDVRALVDRLEDAAGGASLQVGQRIVLP